MAVVPLAIAVWFLLVKAPRAVAVVVLAALCGAALFFPFIASSDPYAYAYYGYETTVGVKPYHPQQTRELESDAALSRLEQLFPAGSSVRIPNYGPVSLAEYAVVAKFAGPSLLRFIMTARVVNLLLALCCGLLCALCAANGISRWQAFAYFVNPLVLVESVAFVHSDVLMLALLLAAFLAYRRGALPLCAALICLATLARSIAGLAFIPLLAIVVPERGLRGCFGMAAAAVGTLVSVAAVSDLVFGGFGLGGSPAIEMFSSPASVLLSFVMPAQAVLVAGATCQAVFGLVLTLAAVARRAYSMLPLTALAILPMVRSWYAQWAVPLLSVSDDVRVRWATVILTCTAIFAEWPELTGHTDRLTWSVVLLVQWGSAVVAFAVASRRFGWPGQALVRRGAKGP